jgi:uncharacterized protein YprB with RNaseH-like and TPR domain
MLTNTFRHIPGIGETTEAWLWSAGITSWESALGPSAAIVPKRLKASWATHIKDSLNHHAQGNLAFFAQQLRATEHWRLYSDFRDSCAFVDIETTGFDYPAVITTIALYDGRTIRYYVNGRNLDDFPADLEPSRLIVTYNGRAFDVPRIEGYFRIRLRQGHIDLRYPLRSLGFKGGLKGCEQVLGIGRPGLEGLDGYAAVLLWDEYRRNNSAKALETLLAYNIQDVVSLHTLMVHAHNEKVKATPFASSYCLPLPARPEVPFSPDPETVARIRQRLCPLNISMQVPASHAGASFSPPANASCTSAQMSVS